MKELILKLLPEFLKPLIRLLYSKVTLVHYGTVLSYLTTGYCYVENLISTNVSVGIALVIGILSYIFGYLQSRNRYKPSIKNLNETDHKILKLILEAENMNISIDGQLIANTTKISLSVIKSCLIKFQIAELIVINQHDEYIYFTDSGRNYTLTLTI